MIIATLMMYFLVKTERSLRWSLAHSIGDEWRTRSVLCLPQYILPDWHLVEEEYPADVLHFDPPTPTIFSADAHCCLICPLSLAPSICTGFAPLAPTLPSFYLPPFSLPLRPL